MGIFVDSRVSAPLVPDLSRSFRVVTYDPRGIGCSDRPATGYRLDDHVADALAVMTSAGLTRASLIGASLGTEVAVILAARHPELVDRLILIDPTIDVDADPAVIPDHDGFWAERASYDGWERWNAAYWRRDWPGFARWFLGAAFNEPGSEALVEAILALALDADPDVLIEQQFEQYRENDGAVAPAHLTALMSPTLVLHGELDQSAPLEMGEAVAARIPGATLAVVAGGCHRPDIRSPELVNPLLIEFLRGTPLTVRPRITFR